MQWQNKLISKRESDYYRRRAWFKVFFVVLLYKSHHQIIGSDRFSQLTDQLPEGKSLIDTSLVQDMPDNLFTDHQ